MTNSDLLVDGAVDATTTIILAHGAGAGMDTPFMAFFSAALGARGYRVVRFEFPYMERRRLDGGKRPPDRAPVLLDTWRQIVAEVRRRYHPERLVVGGKSMGGRMASLIAEEVQADALVALGYPFHPAGKPVVTEARAGHLAKLTVPTLIVQGTRDALGNRDTVAEVPLSGAVEVAWMEDGDHSLKPRKASGRTLDQNLTETAEAIDRFLNRI